MELFKIDLGNKPYGFVKHCKINEPEFVEPYWNKTLN